MKNLKSLIVIILLLVSTLFITACSNNLIGTWATDSGALHHQGLNELTFNRNGICIMKYYDEIQNGEYKVEKNELILNFDSIGMVRLQYSIVGDSMLLSYYSNGSEYGSDYKRIG